jgi:hypothetical protein
VNENLTVAVQCTHTGVVYFFLFLFFLKVAVNGKKNTQKSFWRHLRYHWGKRQRDRDHLQTTISFKKRRAAADIVNKDNLMDIGLGRTVSKWN